MTLDQARDFFKELGEKVTQAAKERVVPAAANTLNGIMKDRIFDEGLDANGSKIGQYSTKPYYLSKKNAVRASAVKPKGKFGDTKHKNGQPHKTQYLPNGYKEARDVQQLQSGYKDYRASGSGERSIQVVEDGSRTVIAIVEERESKKLRGNEKRDGKTVFAVSEKEKTLYVEIVTDLLEQEIDRIKNG